MIAGRTRPGGNFGIVQTSLKRVSVMELATTAAWRDFCDDASAAQGSLAGCTTTLNMIDKDRSYRLEPSPHDQTAKTKCPGVTWDLVCEMRLPVDASGSDLDAIDAEARRLDQRHAKSSFHVLVNEIAIRQFDPARQIPAVKRFGFIQRRTDLTPESLCHAWRDEHAPIFALDDLIRRYSVNLTDRALQCDAEWDGYAELWWDDQQHIEGYPSQDLCLLMAHKARSNASRSLYLFLQEI